MNELLTKGIGHTEFKDSPVGKIPVGWEVKKFGEMVTLQYGKSPKDIKSDEGTYPIFGTGGFVGLGTDYLYNGDSIVIGRKGTIDKPSFIQGKFWAIDTTYYIDSYRKVFPKWFFYRVVQECLSKYNEATGVPSLNRDTFNSIISIVPPLPEQQKIASILTSVDEVIEKTQSQINKLQDMKKGTMNELLTKGIGHTEFKDSPVGKIPKGWETKQLCQLCIKNAPITYGVLKPGAFIERGIPLLQIKDIVGEKVSDKGLHLISDKLDDEYSRSRVVSGDIVISLVGTIGRVAIIPEFVTKMNIHRNLGRIRVEDSRFLFQFLRSDNCKNQLELTSSGSSQSALNLSSLRELSVPFPPLPEQQKIASILSSMDSHIEEKQRKLEQTQSLKKSLMQDLLTGKVRVTVH